MKYYVALTLLALSFTSCATTQNLQESKKPEIYIQTQDLNKVKSTILSTMVDKDYVLVKDTPYLMEFQRKAKGFSENLLVALTIGNAYSENYVFMDFMIARLPNKIRIVLVPGIKAIMPGGQVNTQDLLNNASVRQECQEILDEIKKKITNSE